ncbi:tRNA (adenosine(37)-N6)-dimethylallyltransferase MiaA [soil metagenome]
MPSPKRAVLIAGPTASGKSALALKIACEEGGVVINADAMQVYGDLRILTARPSLADEAAVPHRLYGHVDGADSYSVARWLGDARREMRAAWAFDRVAIIVGGTGLYFRALEQGLADIPAIPDAVRRKWREWQGDLHAELLTRDPQAAARLKPGDRQRLMRALEVVEATGKPLGAWQTAAASSAVLAGATVRRLAVEADRALLHARADARLAEMFDSGAAEEVRSLAARRLDPALPVMKAIGVPELASHLRGEISLAEALAAAQTATRQYIKRQFTWSRNQMADWESVLQ